MYQIHVGSVLLKDPNNEYIHKGYHYSEWKIPSEELHKEEELFVVKKTFLTKLEKLKIWLDVFSEIFPKDVINDAKRICFDMRFEGQIANCSPSLCALSCLYLSCLFHEYPFEKKIERILEKKNDGLELFGLRRRRYIDSGKTPYMVKKYSKMILRNMPEKFEKLERMWKKLEAISDE